MYEDGYGNAIAGMYAPGHDPRYQQRMNMFNLARSLFPYPGTPDDKGVKAGDVIKAAREIESYLNGDNS